MTTITHWTGILLAVMAILIWGGVSLASTHKPIGTFTLSLEDVAEGKLPPGWKVAATNPKGGLAEWAVVRDVGAPGQPKKVLSLTKAHDGSRGVFNLCWNPQVVFQDGEIEVMVRANSGAIDQGGGIIWRARDANNYYIARYNPLERNFRLYFVKDGKRQMLADKGDLEIKPREWFTLKIVHRDNNIEGSLNGENMWTVTDKTFTNPGGIGFWTKADAATSFADLHLRP